MKHRLSKLITDFVNNIGRILLLTDLAWISSIYLSSSLKTSISTSSAAMNCLNFTGALLPILMAIFNQFRVSRKKDLDTLKQLGEQTKAKVVKIVRFSKSDKEKAIIHYKFILNNIEYIGEDAVYNLEILNHITLNSYITITYLPEKLNLSIISSGLERQEADLNGILLVACITEIAFILFTLDNLFIIITTITNHRILKY